MPSVPIAMPSEMVGVPKICGVAAGVLRCASTAASASGCSPQLQGVIVRVPVGDADHRLCEVALLVAHARSTSSGSARGRRPR
jgi:hypothetical protein